MNCQATSETLCSAARSKLTVRTQPETTNQVVTSFEARPRGMAQKTGVCSLKRTLTGHRLAALFLVLKGLYQGGITLRFQGSHLRQSGKLQRSDYTQYLCNN